MTKKQLLARFLFAMEAESFTGQCRFALVNSISQNGEQNAYYLLKQQDLERLDELWDTHDMNRHYRVAEDRLRGLEYQVRKLAGMKERAERCD